MTKFEVPFNEHSRKKERAYNIIIHMGGHASKFNVYVSVKKHLK